jgi:hypothetical protein
MVLALDRCFNALNEVRVLCDSLLENDGRLAGTTSKLDPAKSLLKCEVGDKIDLDEADFEEIENRYP